MAERNDRISFEIRAHLGSIPSKNNGWDKQLNLISWNGQEPPKFDIRSWSRDQKHMSRGITLFEDEMQEIVSMYLSWKNERVIRAAQRKKERQQAYQEPVRMEPREPVSAPAPAEPMMQTAPAPAESQVTGAPEPEGSTMAMATETQGMASEECSCDTAGCACDTSLPPDLPDTMEASVAEEEVPF